MKRSTTMAVAAIALTAGLAVAHHPARAAEPMATEAAAGAKAPAAIPDFQVAWRLDPAASDAPPRAMSGRAWRRGGGGPGAGGSPPEGGAPPEGGRRRNGGPLGGGRPARLPDLMHVTHTETLVSFEDSAGTVVQEITTTPEADTLLHVPGAMLLHGAWKDQALEVERTGRQGALRQSYAIEDNGRSLVVRTTMSPAVGEPRTFKRVYRRVES